MSCPDLSVSTVTRWPRFGIAALFGAALLSVAPDAVQQPAAQAPDRPAVWVGTLTEVLSEDFSRQESPWADGVWTSAFTVRVRWREDRRIAVTDARGRTVGQFVVLVDDGSRWDATATGVATARRRRETTALSGAGSGGHVLQAGWLYRSLVDDDPLKDVLPSGTYVTFAMADLNATEIFTAGDGTRIVQRAPAEFPPQQMIAAIGARLPVIFWSTTAPNTPPPQSLTADGVRRLVAHGTDLGYSDPERRTLVNGRMQGSFEVRGRASEAGVSRLVTWDLHRRLNVSGTIDPVDPGWRPKVGSQISVRAAIDPALGLTGRFRFTLFDVSREKGVALNAGSGTDLDLQPASGQPQPMSRVDQTADGYIIETSSALAEASVTIEAADYGAWGRLKAEVNVDGEWYALQGPQGAGSITLPDDENGNRIWDRWERNTGVWGQAASADADATPEGAGPGDGFSNYEEYRGVTVKGQWLATDPTIKNLFIFDGAALGVGHFGESGIVTYLIEQDEYDRKRVVNFNRGYATLGQQKGLHIEDKNLEDGVLGEVWPTNTVPNLVTHLYVDTEKIRRQPDPGAAASVVAHEIGHAVAIPHHGPDPVKGSCHDGPTGQIAPWAGAYAGDTLCIMAYSAPLYYRSWDRRCYEYDITWPNTWGSTFCNSKAGTGINQGARRMQDGRALPMSGDATHGACLARVRLK
jgi:hypothetical protein